MNHPALVAALVEDRRRQCPCGAVSRQGYGLCRECRAAAVWRCEARQPARHSAPGLTHEETGKARLFAQVAPLFQIISKGPES
jgi:hypothetical protein